MYWLTTGCDCLFLLLLCCTFADRQPTSFSSCIFKHCIMVNTNIGQWFAVRSVTSSAALFLSAMCFDTKTNTQAFVAAGDVRCPVHSRLLISRVALGSVGAQSSPPSITPPWVKSSYLLEVWSESSPGGPRPVVTGPHLVHNGEWSGVLALTNAGLSGRSVPVAFLSGRAPGNLMVSGRALCRGEG